MDKKELIHKIVDFAMDKNLGEDKEQWFVRIAPHVEWISVGVYLFGRKDSSTDFTVRYSENTDKQYEYFLRKIKEVEVEKNNFLGRRESERKEKQALVESLAQAFGESKRGVFEKMNLSQLRDLAGEETIEKLEKELHEERFIMCIPGDGYSSFWNVFLDMENKEVYLKGDSITGASYSLDHFGIQIEDVEDMETEDIVSEVKEYFTNRYTKKST
jgi:hypothetical protein